MFLLLNMLESRKGMLMKKKMGYILVLILTTFFLVFFPLLLEHVLAKETGFSADVWFGFIASYLGAVGTVSLGVIALWQNKRYKELSDRSAEETKSIQKELAELNRRTVRVLETLEEIEVAINSPALIWETNFFWYGIQEKDLAHAKDWSYQKNYLNMDPEDICRPAAYLLKKYETFGFYFINAGEKAIRNLNVTRLQSAVGIW